MGAVEFFSTRTDSLNLLRRLESIQPMTYVLVGVFESKDSPVYRSCTDIPSLGYVTRADRGASDRYMVYDRPVEVVCREVVREDGGINYFVDPWKNPPCVLFTAGGLYKEQCMIAGLLETAATAPAAVALFKSFAKAIQQEFTRVRDKNWDCYVGREARELLATGLRFTVRLGRSTKLDLRRNVLKGK
jgi:hypothetical protein